jgi:spermidine synthase
MTVAPPATVPLAALRLLFFLSGASGLVFEIVWMRLLSLTLSVTVYAVATVLAAFMAGLALGAAVAARTADRVHRPLLAYGLIELAVAATAFATPTVLTHLDPGYVWLSHHLGGGGIVFAIARFLLAFAVILVPCSLMGATLPLLGRVVAREHTVGRQLGALYATNTFGAVAGCLAAGFLLIPQYGLAATSAAAASVSAGVGLLAVLMGRRVEATSSAPGGGPALGWSSREVLVCVAFAVSGFAAMGYEVLWTRGLEPFTHNSTYAYSAILATFLLGIGLGSAVIAPRADRLRRPLLALGLVEIGIGLSVIGALLVYARLGTLVPALAGTIGGLSSWSRVMVLVFAETSLMLLVTTLLCGATFPLVARAVVGRVEGLGGRIATAYAANTVGSIAGALVAGFVLLPALGMRQAFLVIVLMNLAVGVALALREAAGVTRAVVVALGLATAIAAPILVPARLFERSFSERFHRLLFYREQATDTVMVTEDARGQRMIRYADGRGTAGTMTVREDRAYSHIAMLLHPAPRKVLSICFGVGNSLASVLTYPVERVDAVELSPGVIEAAPFFRASNRDALADPRVRLIIQDGRNFLLTSRETYDVIRLDPPELHSAGVVNLYTREFFELARAHLRPDGVFSIWVNIVMTPEEDLRLIARTLQSVFPYVSVWRGPLRYSWVFNASLEPRPPDAAVILQHLDVPAVRADLASTGVPDVFAFLLLFVLAGDEVSQFAGPGPLVTDDHTRLDFSVPRSLDAFYGFANANTDAWMVDLMGPGAGKDGGAAIFLRKIALMRRHERPVLPHIVHPEATGLDVDGLRARLALAESGDAHPPSTGQPTGSSPRQPS